MRPEPFEQEIAASSNGRDANSKRWRIALLLASGVLVNYFDRINISVAHDALHSELGISSLTFGLLLSAFNWTYMLTQIPMGALLDRFGVKLVTRASTLLWSIASFAGAIAPGVNGLFGARLLLGVGEAPTFPANAKAIGQWFPPEQRSFPTAIFDSAAKFGPAIGVPVVGILMIHYGWRWSFAATGIVSLAYFAVFYFTYHDPADFKVVGSTERPGSAPLAYLLGHKKVLGLVLGFFGYNYCFFLLLLWLPTYFSELKLSPLRSILYSAIPWLFATAADLFVGGFLVDHLIVKGYDHSRVRKGVLITGTSAGLLVAGPVFTQNPIYALVWITLALMGLSAAAPVGWTVPALIAPRNSEGKVGSIFNTGNQLAGAIAPIVTGYVLKSTHSMGPAFAIAAVLLIAGIGSYLFLMGRIEPIAAPTLGDRSQANEIA